MTNKTSKKIDPIRLISILIGIALVIILICRWIFEINGFKIDSISLIIIAMIISVFLFPYLSEIKIFKLFEIKRLDQEISDIKKTVLKGKVVRDEFERLYYIDGTGEYHLLKDMDTAIFLRGLESIIPIKYEELENYLQGENLQSVHEGELVIWNGSGGHYFIILNNMKFHVYSASFLADWSDKIKQEIDDDEIKKYKTGK